MAVKVEIPSPLREHTGGQTEVAVAGATVQAALDDLVRQFPSIGPKLFDGGKLRPYINVFLNDENIHHLQKLETPVKAGDEISIVPAIAGGAH